ncbi:MAG: ABC transporter ATP-binding protein [Armatimonadetes bacterium]|nr:ABC transporter ATP-binding protein [Armatimonadota bacterium]
MLEVTQLVKDYGALRAVDGVSFTVRPGEIVGLLGPNGAGKTTVMRCIAGILRPTAGSVLINGHDLRAEQREAKRGLAFVPEVPALYELLTVREHLRFIAMCFDRLDVFDARGDELLARYDLLEKADAFVATLSKGMKQKLAVACALIHDANVLLLDEPLIGVDPKGAHEFKAELMRRRDSGCSVLLSTHLLDTAERFCDRIIIMGRGRNLAEGTMEELRRVCDMQGATLEEVFLKLTEEPGEAAFDLSAP